MISKTQKKKLKNILGRDYSKDVLKILDENGAVNRLGNPYNTGYIIWVFNGERNNHDVEEAIFKLYENKIIDLNQRKAILKNKKPEAATSGS